MKDVTQFIPMKIDLHMHSTVSDGRLSPKDVMTLAHENGVQVVSLTDHDTMDGTHLAQRTAESLGMHFIPGVEVSTQWGGRVIHVVGLGMDAESAVVENFFRDVCLKRDRRGRAIGEKLEALLGIKDAYTKALALADNKDNLSRTHFARMLFEEGYVKTYQEAFDRFLSSSKPCCVNIDWPTLAEVVELIHGAGGVAVVAHPGRYLYREEWMREALMNDFKALGGDAIEVISGSQSSEENFYWAQVCRQMGFLASCGSDFHSLSGSRPMPGCQGQLPQDLLPVWRILKWN